jgi:hypothetical protein
MRYFESFIDVKYRFVYFQYIKIIHHKRRSIIPRALGPVFMFRALELVFGGTEVVRSRFHIFRSLTYFWRGGGRQVPFSEVSSASALVFQILRSRTSFRWYGGCRVLFSCFARPDSFSAVPRASVLVFMFCPPKHVFDGTDGVGSRFHVLRSRSRFRRYRGRWFPF